MKCYEKGIDSGKVYDTILKLLKRKKTITSVDVAKELDVELDCVLVHTMFIVDRLKSDGVRVSMVKYCDECKKVYHTTSDVCPIHKKPFTLIYKYEKVH